MSEYARQALGIFTNSRRRRMAEAAGRKAGFRSFPPFLPLGTTGANVLASLPDGPDSAKDQGRLSMTFNLANVQQIAISAVCALFAASLFISAAVGPAGQLI
jgi:hypothetical protein